MSVCGLILLYVWFPKYLCGDELNGEFEKVYGSSLLSQDKRIFVGCSKGDNKMNYEQLEAEMRQNKIEKEETYKWLSERVNEEMMLHLQCYHGDTEK